MLRSEHFFREQDQPTSKNFVVVSSNKTGCSSFVGMINRGAQPLNLARGCFRSSTIMHEFMHALGVHHYQNRPDRDEYVTIFFDNIKEGKENNFQRKGTSEIHGTAYDVESFMHYRWNAFAIDKTKPTIRSKVYAKCIV